MVAEKAMEIQRVSQAKGEDISLVIEELERLKQWLSGHTETGVPQAVVMRIDRLLQALHNVRGDAQVAVYIG